MTEKIVIITSGQPSLNPRLVKEADALTAAGYEVIVLYAYWNEWATRFDESLLNVKPWKSIRVGGSPVSSQLLYFFSRLIHKVAVLTLSVPLLKKYVEDFSVARSSYFLIKEAKKKRADLYIGHNIGALPAVVKAARLHHAKCGFDAEDFHRFEINDDLSMVHYKVVTSLEDKYLRKLDYLTASSNPIGEAYQSLYPELKPVTIQNAFPKSNIQDHILKKNGVIRIFWFSQTIGLNRGIKELLNALNRLENLPFELHLLGQSDEIIKRSLKDGHPSSSVPVFFYDPIHPNEIVDFATQFDIGLASERPEPYNRSICLTNKLFVYLQAGLAILASDTIAQQDFLQHHPGVGKVYTDGSSLETILIAFAADRELLDNYQRASLKCGQTVANWETESIKLLSVIKRILQ